LTLARRGEERRGEERRRSALSVAHSILVVEHYGAAEVSVL
jgi:hypothetical protein